MAVMGNLIHGVHELNWIQFPNESRWIPWFCWESWVWIELVLVNLTWVLTQFSWIPSESESLFSSKNPRIGSMSQLQSISQLDIMKEAVAGLFCMSIFYFLSYNTHKCTGFWQSAQQSYITYYQNRTWQSWKIINELNRVFCWMVLSWIWCRLS